MDTTTAHYLKYKVDEFYSSLVTLQRMENGSDEEMETLYALGYNLFTYGKYEEGRKIFQKLTDMAPHTAHYWRALGATNQQLKNYSEAIAAYNIAITNDESDVVSYVYRGEARIMSGNALEGEQDLEHALKIGSQTSQYDSWVNRAKLLLHVRAPT